MQIAISLGDPRGVGPEIIATAVQSFAHSATIFGDPAILQAAAQLLKLPDIAQWPCKIVAVSHDPQWRQWDDAHCGRQSMAYVASAVEYCLKNSGTALVTAPISKHRWHQACGRVMGHTEYLQELSGATHVGMMMASPQLRAVPITIHVPLADVARTLTTAKIVQQGQLTAEFLQQHFGIAQPRLAITGLNPHAGDHGSIGREEMTIIQPAIAQLKALGIHAAGPFPADTIFTAEQRKYWDVILAMYHDQALIPAKALDFENTVNITMGLPFIRTSVDHGTAEDIAWQGQANAQHLRAAITMAQTLSSKGSL